MKPQDAGMKNRPENPAQAPGGREGRPEGGERRRRRRPEGAGNSNNNNANANAAGNNNNNGGGANTVTRSSKNQRGAMNQEARSQFSRFESRKPDPKKPEPKKKERRAPDKRLYAPVSGEIIPLSSVADPVFAQKMMGDGIAFIPEGDLVVSPCYGVVAMIASAKNAIGIENDFGDQILVHIGLDTIDYNGKGIELLCQEGQKVRPGNPLVRLDRRFFDSVNADLTIPMTITNQDFGVYQMLEGDRASAGKTPVLERH